ncbi:MAG TPA: M28 family peptidase, partial [Bacteroidales bacterium]|nr:M28 family peptidase [Bacteroidales bacterium]
MKLPGIFVFLFLLCTVAYSQDLDYAKTIVKKLTSPELQGRGYTGKGDQLAAAFIADEFKSMGLLPLAKTYYQKFNISINTFPGALSLKLNDEALTPGVDYLVESSSPSIKGMFDIVKTSRKELDSEQKLIELIKILPGKFVLIDNTVKSENKELNKTIDDYISFLKYSPDIACKGIIIFTKEKLTWENSTFQNVRPIIVVNKELDLKNVSKIELIVESKFIEKYETQNVAAYIKGSLNPDSFIVVTAHYDHLGKMGSEALFPGANDNASGVAMMLNLAKHYAQNPPEYSIAFIALSAEEVGLLGAKEFTEHPLIKLKNI